MGLVKFEVHTLLKDTSYPKVVRIRADAYKAFQGGKKCIVQIRYQAKYAYFEAVYADDFYINRWKQITGNSLGGNDLVFMGKLCRESLNVNPGNSIELKEIKGNDLQMLYAVHTALSEDSNEGRIYILPSSQNKVLRDKMEDESKRPIVSIKRTDRKDAKPVYSEALFADRYYLKKWEEKWKDQGKELEECNVIFISTWYRYLLGVKNKEIVELNVKPLDQRSLRELWALLYLYPRNHPQAVVRTANMVGIIGFGSGVIGIGLGVVGIQDWLVKHIPSPYLTNFWAPIGFVICLVGIAIAILGIKGLIRRR